MKKKIKLKAIKKKTAKGARGPRPYKKCIEMVVKMAEEYADYGDCSDEILDQIGALKKRLDNREQAVIGALASGAFVKVIEIDEASPGSELQFKV
jgi:hypothetical protein